MSGRPWGDVVKRAAVTAGIGATVGAPLQAVLMAAFWVHPWRVALANGYSYAYGALLGALLGVLLLIDEGLARVEALHAGLRRSLLLLAVAVLSVELCQLQYQWLMERSSSGWLEAAVIVLRTWGDEARVAPLVAPLFMLPVAFGLTLVLRRRGSLRSLAAEAFIAGGLTALLALVTVTALDIRVTLEPAQPGTWWTPWWESLVCHWTAEIAAFGVAFATLSPLLLAVGRRWTRAEAD